MAVPRQKAPLWERDEIKARLLVERGDLLVVNKPYDWPTTGHTLDDQDCLQYHLMAYFQHRIWSVHQLDADTTGVCLFTKEKKSVALYHQKLSAPTTRKEYLAFVRGTPRWEEQRVALPLGKVDAQNHGPLPTKAGGKEAYSEFQVLKRYEGYTLLQARIRTGRTHQIRIHLASLGYPLLGEEWYTTPRCTRHVRQALHASRLSFHPSEEYHAPLPGDWSALLPEGTLSPLRF